MSQHSQILEPTKKVKSFLEMAQPLEVKYGYIRGIATENSYVTYRNVTSDIRRGIGNQYISERVSFVVTVQTRTAEQNLIYSTMIKYAAAETAILFVSEDLRKDPLVENGWINTIILNAFISGLLTEGVYTKEEVFELLSRVAERYVMITSLYKDPESESIIDKFVIPTLEDRDYTLSEILQMKAEYLDRFVLTITEY